MTVRWKYDQQNVMRIETFDPLLVESALAQCQSKEPFVLFNRQWHLYNVEWDTNNGRGLTAVIEASLLVECNYAPPQTALWAWQ